LGEKTLRLLLFTPAPKFSLELGPELGGAKEIGEAGGEIVVNFRVWAVWDQSVTLTNGMVIKSATIIWSAGTTAKSRKGPPSFP
jgi:hypothetical protein